MRRTWRGIVALTMAFALVAGACGDDEEEAEELAAKTEQESPGSPPVDPPPVDPAPNNPTKPNNDQCTGTRPHLSSLRSGPYTLNLPWVDHPM